MSSSLNEQTLPLYVLFDIFVMCVITVKILTCEPTNLLHGEDTLLLSDFAIVL